MHTPDYIAKMWDFRLLLVYLSSRPKPWGLSFSLQSMSCTDMKTTSGISVFYPRTSTVVTSLLIQRFFFSIKKTKRNQSYALTLASIAKVVIWGKLVERLQDGNVASP